MNKQLLIDFYLTDPYLVSTYHGMEGMTAESCAEDTWEVIKDADSYVTDFGYFTVDRTKGLITQLTGFFIKPEFRNKEGYNRFYKEVCEKMPKYFMSTTHKDNKKVINFLSKMGGKQFYEQNTDNMIYFLFQQESK